MGFSFEDEGHKQYRAPHSKVQLYTLGILGPNLISWSSCNQLVVPTTSTKVEYKALENGAAEATWVKSFLKKLGVCQPRPRVLWCDNLEATYLTTNLVFHARMKHIEVNCHFVREKVEMGALDVRFISSND
ncbi:hypothetical protein LXL04_009666 [Taraxacum kok-saghyz]